MIDPTARSHIHTEKKWTQIIHGDTRNFYWHGSKNYGLHCKISRNTVYFTKTHAIIIETSVIFPVSPWIIRVPFFLFTNLWKMCVYGDLFPGTFNRKTFFQEAFFRHLFFGNSFPGLSVRDSKSGDLKILIKLIKTIGHLEIFLSGKGL